MRSGTREAARRVLPAAVAWMLLGSAVRAQDAVIVACSGQGPCAYQRAYSVTLQGKDSVKTAAPAAANDAQLLRKGRSVRLNSLLGLYREPQSGLLLVVGPGLQLGDIAVPSKLPQGAVTASAALAGAAFEYAAQAKSKAKVSVPIDRFVALLKGPRLEGAVVAFVKREMQADAPHPLQADLLAGALSFAEASPELGAWREELRTTMRRNLDAFRGGGVDPARLEATLEDGIAAMRVYRLVALKGQEEKVLQDELTAAHRRLVERFVIAGVLKRAGEHDAFLEKIGQIGLARWSRPDLAASVDASLRASAQSHLQRATELLAARQYDRAFDEAQLASSRAPCDEQISRLYDTARVQFVNDRRKPVSPEYEKEHRIVLEQIVREIQGIGLETGLTPERIEYVRRRIRDGEDLDKDYLPLQLRKAEFLANRREYMAAREVVTRVERSVPLGAAMAEHWLQLDARLTGDLAAFRGGIEKQVTDLIAREQFKEALDEAAKGLKTDPGNKWLLYHSAIAAAVIRDQPRARALIEEYLDAPVLNCSGTANDEQTLFELYRRADPAARAARAEGSAPNWMSGEPYAMGEVFYDPLSGSFQFHVSVSSVPKGDRASATEFRWDGFMAVSITTTINPRPGEPILRDRTVLAIEPVYDPKRIYMTGIAGRANSAGERRVLPLRYLNCPDFDPVLASKFTNKVSTRGWAGNPFFHPFLWNDIFLFDLEYDELGRIKTARPVSQDVSRPTSPLSEPLAFTWDGRSKRLLAIRGVKYLREMAYDQRGRLVSERITHPQGNGKIEYRYQGDTMQLVRVECEDNFYDRASRTVFLEARER